MVNGKSIYLVSDAHIGAPFPDAPLWEKQCIGFFRSIADRASALYILGDLFDFWIEYRSVIRADYFAIAHELKTLIEHGIPIHYFAGNHDFAFGPFITTTLGMTVHPGHEELLLQGKRVHIFHGDGLIRGDVGYRILRRILRNRMNQALFKVLPPAIGIPLASFFSGTSRTCGEGFMTEKKIAEYREHARQYLDNGRDIVFFAHSHKAELHRWGDKTYCNTGAWMRTNNFATMADGIVRLWRYRDGADPEELPPAGEK